MGEDLSGMELVAGKGGLGVELVGVAKRTKVSKKT